MSFFNPTYLWALLGLLVPIAIHLWSKKEGKTIKIGSIELLRESEFKQTSSIQPNEILLLLLRLFIIALVVFVLAEPQFQLKTDKTAITYLIEPSLLNNDKSDHILNSIDDSNDIRLLTSGFPIYDAIDLEDLSTVTPNYWNLAKEMQSLNSDSIVVYTKALNSGFKGKRPTVNKNIEWVIINDETHTVITPIKARSIDGNIELLLMQSNAKYTAFEKTLINGDEYTQNDLEVVVDKPIQILLYYDDDFNSDSRYIEASLKAVSKHINRDFEITKTQDSGLNTEGFDLIIWFTQEKMAPNNATKTILFKADHLSHSIIEDSLNKNQFHLTSHLSTENSIEHFLPEQLLKVLDLNSDVKQIIKNNDKRAFSKAELLPTFSDNEVKNKSTNYLDISKWLWLILGITLLGERIVANYRKQ